MEGNITTAYLPINIAWIRHYIHDGEIILFSSLYVIVLVLAVIGNMILIILARQNMTGGLRTITNIFLVNLALCDLLIACLVIPYRLTAYIFNRWPLGSFLCFIMPPCEKVLFTASIFQLLVISLVRYKAVTQPFKPLFRLNQCLGVVALIWLSSLIGNIPLFIKLHTDMFHPILYDDIGDTVILVSQCRPKWDDSGWYPRFYYTAQNLMHGLPILASIILYYITYRRIQDIRSRGRASHPALGANNLQTLKMLIAILVLTVVCWLPYTIITTVLMFTKLTGLEFVLPLGLCKWFAIFNTSHNPIMCIYFSQAYRVRFMYFIGKRSERIVDQINLLDRRRFSSLSCIVKMI